MGHDPRQDASFAQANFQRPVASPELTTHYTTWRNAVNRGHGSQGAVVIAVPEVLNFQFAAGH